ncbi:MAG: SDR family oxidoreductase [Ruminococcaceae bacterium]|nr:SDR family oxidoreductase [Oscillospiraceae bacterium]
MELTLNFENKSVLITGGASGMGLLLGQCYAKAGAKVALVDINGEELDKQVAEIAAYNPNVMGICIDIRDYQKVEEARDAVVERFGSIDILVNCAGGAEKRILKAKGEFHEVPIEVYDFGIDVNLKGALYFDHAVMAQMAKQMSGVIVHLGSITGQEGCSGNVAYSASKSALMNGMTKSIALAGAPYNVRCICVAPGPVLTRAAMAKMKTLMDRAAEPQEIVDFILFATSEKGAFMTGTNYLIDGGRDIMRNKT